MLARGSLVKTVALIVVLSLCLMLLLPSVAFAFNIFRVKVPERLTRPLSPLAPIAQIWLLRKVPKFEHIVKKASEIKSVTDDIEQQKKVQEVRQVYRDQAVTFRSRAKTLGTKRKALAKELVRNKLEWSDYKGKVAAIQQMIHSLNAAADRLDEKAAKLRAQDIITMFTKRAANTLLANAKGLVVQEIASEIDGMVNPVIVSAFLDGDGLKVNEVIDHLINGDIERLIKNKDLGTRTDLKELRRRIRDRVRSGAKDDIDFLKDTWESELDAMIEELVTKADGTGETPGESPNATATDPPEEPADAPNYDAKDGRIYEGVATFDDVLPFNDGTVQHCPQQAKVVIQLRKNGQLSGRFYTFKNYPIIPINGCVKAPAKLWSIVGTHKNGSFEAQTDYLVKIDGSYDRGSLNGTGKGLLTAGSPSGRYFTIGPFTLAKR